MITKDAFTFVLYLGFCVTEEEQIYKGETLHVAYEGSLSYTDNITPADALETLGVRASAGMVLTPNARIFRLQLQKS